MTRRTVLGLFLSLGLIWVGVLPGQAQGIFSLRDQTTPGRQELLAKLAQARVIYLGETHDSLADHQAQLDLIQSLQRLQPKLAIALEMFQRPYQQLLERYRQGELTEAELLQQSQYQQRWGFPWHFYAPILRFARQQRLPLLALNTPTEVTRQVARQGLQSLSPEEQKYIPPLSEIDLSNPAYRQRLEEIHQQIHQGHGHSGNFEHFLQAQVLWDETMAMAIAEFLQTHPDYLVIVLAGEVHIAYGDGIPSRVARRLNPWGKHPQNPLVQYTLILNPDAATQSAGEPPIADYFWSN